MTDADGRIDDAARLRRLRETGLLDGGAHPSLNRLARAAAHQLRADRALVSLVTTDRRIVAGRAGPAPAHSFCPLVVDTEAPVLVGDARTDERFLGHPAVADGVIAYAGFPLRSADGYVLGAFGVVDGQAREWEPRELLLIEDLAAAAETEIVLRAANLTSVTDARRLRGILDGAADAFVSADAYSTVLAWNDAAEQLFGFAATEAIGRPIADLIIPERFRSAHAAGLARLHGGGWSTVVAQRLELAAIDRYGTEFPVELTLRAGADESGPVYHAFLHDITDRVAAQRQLEHERTFLQTLLDSLDTGVAACDADGRLTLFNRAMRDLHRSAERTLGAGDWADAYDLYAADGRTRLRPDEVPLARAYAGEQVTGQHLVVAPPGMPARTFQANARPIETPDGRRLGAVTAMHDVTEHLRTELMRDLRLAVARAHADSATAEQAANGTVEAVARALGWALGEFWQVDDEAGRISRVGHWAAPERDLTAITGDRPFTVAHDEGLAGRIWANNAELWITGVADDPRIVGRADRIRAAGLHTAIGVPVRSADRVLGVLVFFSAATEEPDAELIDLLDDVCAHLGRHIERRRAQELTQALAEQREQLLAEQQAQNRRLRQLDRLKDELVALVSHELRNPLGAIHSYIETLLEDPSLNTEQRRLAEVIDRRSGHMQDLVDDLLDAARLDAGRLDIDARPTSATELIRDVVAAQRPAASAKDLTVTVSAPDGLEVTADPVRLRQVLDNLLGNAIKYTPAGGAVTVTSRASLRDGVVTVTVSDTGIGIPAEEYPSLFERFFRASNAVEGGIKGTGLGLAITKAIVDAHGGSLTAEPGPAGGTIFTVVLPV